MTDLPVDDAITVQISLDGADDYRAEARRMEDLGADVVIAHLGFDERAEASQRSVFDFLPDVIAGTSLPCRRSAGSGCRTCPGSPAWAHRWSWSARRS
jgi:hypothetical protein